MPSEESYTKYIVFKGVQFGLESFEIGPFKLKDTKITESEYIGDKNLYDQIRELEDQYGLSPHKKTGRYVYFKQDDYKPDEIEKRTDRLGREGNILLCAIFLLKYSEARVTEIIRISATGLIDFQIPMPSWFRIDIPLKLDANETDILIKLYERIKEVSNNNSHFKSMADLFVYSNWETDVLHRFLTCITMLEMLNYDDKSPSIAISTKVTKLIAKDEAEAESIMKDVVNLYDIRSKFLHKGINDVTYTDYKEADDLCRKCLNKLLENGTDGCVKTGIKKSKVSRTKIDSIYNKYGAKSSQSDS